jgi:hypothetical protein
VVNDRGNNQDLFQALKAERSGVFNLSKIVPMVLGLSGNGGLSTRERRREQVCREDAEDEREQ